MPGGVGGVYHTVSKGQTLWRIAKAYQVNIDKIARYNRLDDQSDIKVGQKLFIPGAAKVRQIAPAFSQKRLKAVPGKTNSRRKTVRKPSLLSSLPPLQRLGKPDKIDFIWPVKGKITSRYASHGGTHFGIDIAAPNGTPVVAAAGGRVSYVDYQPLSYGNFIIIQHPNNYVTVYAHNKKNLVAVGQEVRQGMTIAYVGSTGNSTGNHLHFEVRYKRKAKNPLWFLPR